MTEAEIRKGLDRWFGHADFRPGQYAPIEAVVNGRDAVVIMPTMRVMAVTATATPDVRRDIITQLKLEGRASAAGPLFVQVQGFSRLNLNLAVCPCRTPSSVRVARRFRTWRKGVAEELGIPAFRIMTNRTLDALVSDGLGRRLLLKRTGSSIGSCRRRKETTNESARFAIISPTGEVYG